MILEISNIPVSRLLVGYCFVCIFLSSGNTSVYKNHWKKVVKPVLCYPCQYFSFYVFYVLLNSSTAQSSTRFRKLILCCYPQFCSFCGVLFEGYPITSQKLIIFWIYKYTRDIPLFLNNSEKLILAHLTNVTGNNILTWWSNPHTTIIHLTF